MRTCYLLIGGSWPTVDEQNESGIGTLALEWSDCVVRPPTAYAVRMSASDCIVL